MAQLDRVVTLSGAEILPIYRSSANPLHRVFLLGRGRFGAGVSVCLPRGHKEGRESTPKYREKWGFGSIFSYYSRAMILLPVLLLVGAAALGAWAQRAVLGRFQRYAAIPNRAGLSGAEVARAILAAQQLQDITVERVEGRLSDHYDPRHRVLRLSPDVHDGRSVSAMGIAAHEVGHALQEAMNYAPLGMRNLAVPSAKLGGMIGLPLLLLGAFLHSPALALLGFLLFAGVVLFQLVTVPVELDASRRALVQLQEMHLMDPGEEEQGVMEVLGAASMTYVAAALSGLALLLYYGLQVFGRRR